MKIWKVTVTILIVLGGLFVLASFFYAEEDWRGKRAWENCKSELEAKGEVLDWNAYIPAPVPDDQNFFKAPKMQEWFVENWESRTNELEALRKEEDTTATITNRSAAVAYLAWSDKFKPDFDLIRDALKRPDARMDGDYSDPLEMPTPNFINVRSVAQIYAQRAKCYLLLGQPDRAFDELTLLNDSRRMLEFASPGKPTTLVAAIINVAVTRLYVDTIADGLQSRTWREPQLVGLQEQLKEINLAPIVAGSFELESATACQFFKTLFRKYPNDPSLWQQLEHFRFPWETWAPRGWVYQNMVTVAKLDSKQLDGFDFQNGTILPNEVESRKHEAENVLNHSSPYTFLADIFVVTNTAIAMQTLAYVQTLVNEAQIVCALERYHLAHDEYPESLEALTPQFIEKIPHDIIGGQPLHYRPANDGKFMLYSVGWNEKDDGGQEVSLTKDGGVDYIHGDWVWLPPFEY